MGAIRLEGSKGRDFTAEELVGRQIRIESHVPIGYNLMIIADDESVNNVTKLELSIEPCAMVEAKVTLYRFDQATEEGVPTEVAVLRDNIEVSFSAIVSEVQ